MRIRNAAEIFLRLGLGRHAAAVYQALLGGGPMLPAEAARAIGGHRPAVYRALDGLAREGLVVRVPRGKRRAWAAAPPERLREAFLRVAESLGAALPKAPPKPAEEPWGSMRFYRGKDGIRRVFDDVVERMPRGGTFYRYTSETDLDAVNAMLSPDYRRRRDQKKLERKVISNPVSGSQKKPRLERFVRFMPPAGDAFEQDVIELIYGDRVAFVDLRKKECVVIEHGPLAEFQKTIFRRLYASLR